METMQQAILRGIAAILAFKDDRGEPMNEGASAFSVGATLSVAPGQRPGSYSGKFHVTLEYQ